MTRSDVRHAVALLALLLGSLTPASAARGQSVLHRPPNLGGTWVVPTGTVEFDFRHRFTIGDAPERKVGNAPTFLLATGTPGDGMVGARYGSSSGLVGRVPNEWELFARWRALAASRGSPVDVSLSASYNDAAESFDGELTVAREVGRVRLMLGARAFSAFAGGDARAAAAGGAVVRVTDWMAVAGDAAGLLDAGADEDVAWSAGVQLRIPYTPHTLSLHASNVGTATLESSTVGIGETRWGFEFTVPITLSRYFGGDEGGSGAEAAAEEAPVAAEVTMTNRLAFAPDTVRIRAGEAIRFRNTSQLLHTVTADPGRARNPEHVRLPDGAAPFHSGRLEPGDEYVRVFRVPGIYRYFCVPHEMAGMIGTVIVEE